MEGGELLLSVAFMLMFVIFIFAVAGTELFMGELLRVMHLQAGSGLLLQAAGMAAALQAGSSTVYCSRSPPPPPPRRRNLPLDVHGCTRQP